MLRAALPRRSTGGRSLTAALSVCVNQRRVSYPLPEGDFPFVRLTQHQLEVGGVATPGLGGAARSPAQCFPPDREPATASSLRM